jgi:hypothetical protein
MQEMSYELLVERLVQCEELAGHARDPSIRAKAAELAQGYRKLLSSIDRRSVVNANGLRPAVVAPTLWTTSLVRGSYPAAKG